MQATNVLVAILAAHLLCFAALAFLMGARLPHVRGTREFGYCNTMLSVSFALQLIGDRPDWSVPGVVNHTLSVIAPLVLWAGLRLFLGEPAPSRPTLVAAAAAYTAAQVVVHVATVPAGRFVLLSACATATFAFIAFTMWRSASGIPVPGLRIPLRAVAAMCGGFGVLHAVKLGFVLRDGLPALDVDNWYQVVFYASLSVMAVVLAPLITWMVFIRLTRELEAAVVHDPLTGVLNRRGMDRRLREHLAGRSTRGAVLVLLDLDHFKRLNDTHGHRAGDDALRVVAAALGANVRAGDFVAQTGGEEFIVGCLDADQGEAARLAERLRGAVAAVRIPLAGGADAACTVSVGVSRVFGGMDEFDVAFHDADEAMYAAKRGGRDRVATAA